MFEWFFAHMLTSGELFFAGVWDSILHKGIGWAAIAVLLGLAFASQFLAVIPMVGPVLVDFFKPLRKDLCWAAFAVALVLGGEYIGARDAEKECTARTVVIDHVVNKAVTKSKTPAARAAKDPWNTGD